ncbi:hypothetical protein QYE76_001723 [Lolium multiflorum]|uniref:CCHC-type domain-containing protein n=1 Tax=Lolium multiflorum TaxID=4521 RepID=A0AAD8VZM0_LOLMU|nr:hypothetical protein QYE76_001723 [Lolium multiflorum]
MSTLSLGREDRWRGGRGSDSEETPRSQQDAFDGGRARRGGDRPEPSSARREVRSLVCREEESAAFDELDDLEDPDEEEEAPWEEPTHVTRKRGRRAGKKVAARPTRPERVPGAYDDYRGLCLLCTQPGHRAADCTTGPVCLRCGEAGHMSRECSLPRQPRPMSPPADAMEPARKRVNDAGRARRVDVRAGDHRAHAPEARQAAREQVHAGGPRSGMDRRWVQRREAAPPAVVAAPRQAAAPPRAMAAPGRAAPPPRAAVGRQSTQLGAGMVAVAGEVRAVAPVPVGDRAVVPVLPQARRAEALPRPRRGADEEVVPLALRAPAAGGELARRPARAACVLSRTVEIDEAEDALSRALLAVIVGVRRAVTTDEVAMALEDIHRLPPGSFSVHCHRPEDFLIFFATKEDRDMVLRDEVIESPFFRLLLRPWARRTHAASGGLCVHAELEVEGVPANAWSMATAEAILAPSAWVERLHPLTRSRADMGTFRMSAWCLDPSLIPREMDLHIVEPDDPPSSEDMAAPAQAVVPPHINTLAYPLIIHVTSTVDFRRSVNRRGAGDRSVNGEGGTPAWPARRQYTYTRGVPDTLPGSAEGGSAAASSSSAGQGGGDRGGGVRTLSSGVIVGETVAPSRGSKKRRRGGRKVRELRARAVAEAAGGGALGAMAAVGAVGEQGSGAGASATPTLADEATPVLATEDHRPVEGAGVDAGEVLAAMGAGGDRQAAASAIGEGASSCAPIHAQVDPLVHGPVHRSGDRVVPVQRPVVGAACVTVGPSAGRALDASRSNLAAEGGGGPRSFRVGACEIPFPALECESAPEEPPSLQIVTLEDVAGPFVPRPLLGLDAFASPPPSRAFRSAGPDSMVGSGGRDSAGLGALAVHGQELILSTPSSPFGARMEEESDDEVLDGEIVADPPPPRDGVDTGAAAPPSAAPPSVCRFATPPLVFQRARQTPVPRAPVPLARPRTLGEFLEAAKSRSDALLQTPAVRRRLVELNF